MTVAKQSDSQTAVDNAALNIRLAVIGGVLALALLAVAAVMAALRGGDLFNLATVPFALALLFALAALIYGMLSKSAALEDEEKALLAKRSEARALNVEEDVRFTAGRSFANYRFYAPYVLALLGAGLLGMMLYGIDRSWAAREAAEMSGNPVHSALIAAVMLLVAVFSGAFFVGQSRLPAFRWLRPVGAWLIAGGGVLALAAGTAVAYHNNLTSLDQTIGRVVFWILAVLGCELVVSFVIEFYRPRSVQETRPVYESRLLALFTEPGGVMRNVALALDYQFGFKVSGTWLYGFIERSFVPVLLVWLVMLWGFTAVHEVGPSEVGVKEVLGRVVARDLKPGIYWTLPYPFGKVRTFSCTELRSIVIGENHSGDSDAAEPADDGHGHEAPPPQVTKLKPVVLWTEAHGATDENFIVAVPLEPGQKGAAAEAASISFLRTSIPIFYRIRPEGLMKWAYENADPQKTLRRLGEEAATEYFASASMTEVMSTHRAEAEAAILKHIQELADAYDLGVEIVAVTILDAHPPAENVAPAYQEVIGAMEEKETLILSARTYAASSGPATAAEALSIVSGAEAYEYSTRVVAGAEAKRFASQMESYKAMPEMFRLRWFLDFLEKDAAGIRKYVVSKSLRDAVYEIDFKSKERLDLIDTDITKLSDK